MDQNHCVESTLTMDHSHASVNVNHLCVICMDISVSLLFYIGNKRIFTCLR